MKLNPYQRWKAKHPEQIRVHRKKYRRTHPKQREASKKRNYTRGAKHKWNYGQRWSRNDDLKVLAHSKLDRELSAEIGRPVQVIQNRRAKLIKEKKDRQTAVRKFMIKTGRLKSEEPAVTTP